MVRYLEDNVSHRHTVSLFLETFLCKSSWNSELRLNNFRPLFVSSSFVSTQLTPVKILSPASSACQLPCRVELFLLLGSTNIFFLSKNTLILPMSSQARFHPGEYQYYQASRHIWSCRWVQLRLWMSEYFTKCSTAGAFTSSSPLEI